MAFTSFTLERIEAQFGIVADNADLFPGLIPVPVPDWLVESLRRSGRVPRVSEKARSEFLVAPVLLVCQDLSPRQLTIFSGQRLDVDDDRGLSGECDYILANARSVPTLQAPLVTIVEAKKQDIEGGLGQCAGQMIAARIFNERAGRTGGHVAGCVTTGDVWQFLRLIDGRLDIHNQLLFSNNMGLVLAALLAAFAAAAA